MWHGESMQLQKEHTHTLSGFGSRHQVVTLMISAQKWPFSNSALLHLQSLSFGANFCCPATTVAEFFSCTREKFCSSATTRAECFSPEKYSALLLPQQQNVSHQRQNSVLCSHRNILLFWYHSSRILKELEPDECDPVWPVSLSASSD